MNKLYYGHGCCSIQGDLISLQINYKGAVHITDKTQESHIVVASNKKILIVPVAQADALTNLFDYVGEIKILSVKGVTSDNKLVSVTPIKQIHHPEYMESNAEDMTLLSEEMNADYIYRQRVNKTKVINNILKNQQSKGEYYLQDGSSYIGAYHIHIETGNAMTGGDHSKDSQDLYIKKIKSGLIVPTGYKRR